MLRFLLVFCVLWICSGVVGQQHVVKKSSDVVVIKGKSFYLHTVDVGQTLYSIGKAYGVDVEEIKLTNDKKDNTLSLYEVLKVPYVEAFVRQDGSYYYHKVKKGETLYSISRKFNIKPRKILKFNEQYSQALPVGGVVRLPLNEIDRSAIEPENEEGAVKKETMPAAIVEKVPAKPIIKPDSQFPARQEAGDEAKKKVQETLDVMGVKKKEVPDHFLNAGMPGGSYVKIALLLPFYSSEYPVMTDSLSYGVSANLSARSEQFVYFYEGILLAVDSLKNKGYKVDLHVFDTEKDPAKMSAVAQKLDRLEPDLIIGPVYASVFRALVDNMQNKNVPIVYPLSSRTENLGQYSNFIQVNTSFPVLAEKMAGWIARQGANANIVNIDVASNIHDEDRKVFDHQIKQVEGIRSFKWNFSANPLASFKQYLLPDRENIIILPTTREADVSKVLPALVVYAENYKITVVGLPDWQTFTSVDHENFFKLNTKIFTYSYVDNNSTASRDFAVDFRKYFNVEPNNIAIKAYDMGLYFIELAAKYRDQTLESIKHYRKDGVCSRFDFSKTHNDSGKENQGLYIVNFGSDYQLKISPLED